MAFTVTPNVEIRRDARGIARAIEHLQQPFTATGFAARNPRAAAAEYVREVAQIYSIDPAMLEGIDREPEGRLTNEGSRLRFGAENRTLETAVVSFVETHFGLPIWEAGVTVVGRGEAVSITSSHSTLHYDVKIKAPSSNAKFMPERVDLAVLAQLLELREPISAREGQTGRPTTINSKRLLIYQYDPAQRYDPESSTDNLSNAGFLSVPPRPPLPPVDEAIQPETHYVVSEILYDLPVTGFGELHWRSFIEVETGSVLYVRAFVACATGYVYEFDPVTSGSPVSAGAGDAALNPLRTLQTLPGITPAPMGTPQALAGQYIQLSDFSPPAIAPPTELSGNFFYNVSTDNFSAVNAYYHPDALFRLVEGMGFSIPSYFSGTNANPGFPVPVDHRATVFGCSDCVNAAANGNSGGDGLGSFIFALEKAGTSVGIADDFRVCAHEFGHAILWNRLHSPNFGFAHSMGDSLAVILADPASLAADRFDSFPWVTLSAGFGRRHDRPVAGGWAWGGTQDTGGYNSEQILSTTHFRVYRSIGGDDTLLNRRQLGSRYMLYLIVRAAASLGPSPITPTSNATVWATALINADNGSAVFEGQPGGAYNKVIRWGFEKQGLYQPPGAPTPVTTEGAPPDVDVYIDDGRNGEYPYLQDFWENTSIWNRRNPDGGLTHETPITTVPNYAYVRVKNRGTQTASNVVVRGYHCKPSTGLTWPDDWQAMDTPSLNAPGPISPGGSVVVGPLQWTPTEVGHECMLMVASADGDLSNIDPASTLPCNAGPTAHWRLVPYDNNIGQRNVAPIAGGGGGGGFKASFQGRHFFVNNPFDRTVRLNIEVELPPFLREREWQLQFSNAGGASFTLGPRASREVIISVRPGRDFALADVEKAGVNNVIRVRTVVDGVVVGGMSYVVDPKLTEPPAARSGKCIEVADALLECLNLPRQRACSVRLKKVIVQIDIRDEC